MAAAIGERAVLEECRGATRLRGSPVRTAWWEQDLTLPPEPEEEEGDAAPGREAIRASWEGRSSTPARPRRQPNQELSLEDQRRRGERSGRRGTLRRRRNRLGGGRKPICLRI